MTRREPFGTDSTLIRHALVTGRALASISMAGDSDLDLAVTARLERIGALDRRGASLPELLPELRGLLSDVERWSRSSANGEEVVERLRPASHRT